MRGCIACAAKPTRARLRHSYRPTLETLVAQWQITLNGWEALVSTRASSEVIDYRSFDGRPFSSSVEEIARHVVNHGSYHRGQVALMLCLSGHAPINTDLIAFTRRPT